MKISPKIEDYIKNRKFHRKFDQKRTATRKHRFLFILDVVGFHRMLGGNDKLGHNVPWSLRNIVAKFMLTNSVFIIFLERGTSVQCLPANREILKNCHNTTGKFFKSLRFLNIIVTIWW